MNSYIDLARNTVKKFVETGKIIDIPENISPELTANKAGVFVTIHKKPKKGKKEGELRGCIGTFEPTKDNIATEIISNAISACSKDYRFAPIAKNELDDLEISVDILSKMVYVDDISQLDPKRYGVLLRSKNDSRSGLLLPDIAGIDTIHDQLAIAINKAGLFKNDPVDIYCFCVTRYKEE